MAGKGCDLAFSDVIGELGNDVEDRCGSGNKVATVTASAPASASAEEVAKEAEAVSSAPKGSGEDEVSGQRAAGKKAKSYLLKGVGAGAKLGSPLDWMLDFDLDEDEILKSQSARQCMEDADAGDLRKLGAEGEEGSVTPAVTPDASVGSEKREAFQAPLARPPASGVLPPPKKRLKQVPEEPPPAAMLPTAPTTAATVDPDPAPAKPSCVKELFPSTQAPSEAPSIAATAAAEGKAVAVAPKPSTFLQGSEHRVGEIREMAAHVSDRGAHITRMMEHGERVGEGAAALASSSSKVHAASAVSASEMLSGTASTLSLHRLHLGNHACLLLHGRLSTALDECEARLAELKTLGGLAA